MWKYDLDIGSYWATLFTENVNFETWIHIRNHQFNFKFLHSEFTIVGLVLIASGSGGIKPCVAAFGGEQFTLPEQAKHLALFFSFFYFSINAGSLISTYFFWSAQYWIFMLSTILSFSRFITPILRSDVHCFGSQDCYPLAFGVPAVLMFTSIIVFVIGKFMYKMYPPQGNMFAKVCFCIGVSIRPVKHTMLVRIPWNQTCRTTSFLEATGMPR